MKELPFFKFTPTEWLVGKISFQSLEVQGAFIQCCCMYWKHGGKINKTQLESSIGKKNFSHLIMNDFLKIDKGHIAIKFLDAQIFENSIRSENNKKNKVKADNHWNWKGGITPLNEKIRNSSDIQNWRAKVFMRDDYTCVNCKSKGGYLEAHHIKEFSKYPDLRFEVDNGITLCKPCHLKIHSKNG
jgi:hypothetical protein